MCLAYFWCEQTKGDTKNNGLFLTGVSIYSQAGLSTARREMRQEDSAETRGSQFPFEGAPHMGKASIRYTYLENSHFR